VDMWKDNKPDYVDPFRIDAETQDFTTDRYAFPLTGTNSGGGTMSVSAPIEMPSFYF
jgi:hypothetical protein